MSTGRRTGGSGIVVRQAFRPVGWPIVLIAFLAFTAGCGQIAGAHRDVPRPSAHDGTGGALPSPNGENEGFCAAPSQPPRSTAAPSPPPGCEVVAFVEVVTIGRISVRRNRNGGPVRVRIQGHPPDDPFVICPVHGRGFYSDDFGAPRLSGGFHRHAGNDVFAALGTPIVAPFDGRAVATPNVLGGLAVTVYGQNGYAYNAHLSRYGTLGDVRGGTVIGFVGNTGDAAGGPYHDHFEWHPRPLPPPPLHASPFGSSVLGSPGDPAIDPFPFLQGVCG